MVIDEEDLYFIPYGMDAFVIRDHEGNVYYAYNRNKDDRPIASFIHNSPLSTLGHHCIAYTYDDKHEEFVNAWFERDINNLTPIDTFTHHAFQEQ
jgi:hypothetical protein